MLNVAARVREILDQTTKGVPAEQRETFIALALARAVSTSLPLPSTPVTSVNVYYSSTHHAAVAELVSRINEEMVINTKLATELTFKLYKMRYDLVFNTEAIVPFLSAMLCSSAAGAYLPEQAMKAEFEYGNPDVAMAFNTLMYEFRTGLAELADRPTVVAAIS
jgi:hypothetical protein